MSSDVDLGGATLRQLFDQLVDLPSAHRERRITELGLSETTRFRLTRMLLFDEFSGLTDAERRIALERHQLPDALRDQLASMFLIDSRTSDSVRQSTADAISRAESADQSFDSSLVGTRVGTFRLVKLIGEGGSSTVFEASREAGNGLQTVALKLLRNGLYSADAQRRFRREQSILAQLTHPNIAGLIEGGVSSAGIPYIAMELVEGTPLTLSANARALDLEHRLTLFVVLCRTIEAAHTALVVHRDLKPANVLVTETGDLKVLDFGIAKLLDSADLDTRTASISLTPGYAAPEQFGHGPLTTAVDIYALGVVLAELLTGLRIDGSVRSSTLVADNASSALPAGLPTRAVLVRRLRGDLDAILTTALADEPRMRYSSAGAFADDVERYLAGKPVRAHAQSTRYRIGKFVRRHRIAIAMSATLLLAILVGTAGTAWQARIAEQQRDMARAERDAARLEARLNNALYHFLVGLFRDGVSDAEKLNPREFLARGVAWLNLHSPDDIGSRVLVFTALGELQNLRQDPAAARDLLQPLVDENAAGVPPALAARLRCTLAQAEQIEGKLERARALAEEGIALTRDLVGSARTTLLECRAVAGTALADLNQYEAALTMLRTALSEAPIDSDDAGVLAQRASLEHAFSAVLFYASRTGESIEHAKASLAIMKRLKLADSNDALSTLGNLAIAQLNAGDVLAADESFTQALAQSEHFGRSAGFAQRLVNAASAKNVLEQPEAALEMLDRAETMLRDLSATAPRIHAQATLERGKALLSQGNFAAAQRAFKDADVAIDAAFPPDHFWRGYTAEQRAHAALLQGDFTKADLELARAVETFGRSNESARVALGRAQALGVEIALGRSDTAAALRRLSEAEPAADKTLEPGHWRRAWLQAMRARCLALLGKTNDARAMSASTTDRLARALGPQHPLTRRAELWAAEIDTAHVND